jgi:hypothetical protein
MIAASRPLSLTLTGTGRLSGLCAAWAHPWRWCCGSFYGPAWPGAAPACAPRPWATSGPLIQHSGEAWFYAIFTLCWLVALFLLDRAVTTGSFWALLARAAVVGLTFLAHEFVIALLPGLGLALLSWRGACHPLRARLGPLVIAALPAGLGLAILTAFSLTLRADTAGGTMNEISGLLAFRPKLLVPKMYAAVFLPGWTAWLLGLAVLSAGLDDRRSTGGAR